MSKESLNSNQVTLYRNRFIADQNQNHPEDYLYQAWRALKTGVEKEATKMEQIVHDMCVSQNNSKAARNAILTLPNNGVKRRRMLQNQQLICISNPMSPLM